jgi:hypothetical protein
MKKDITLSSLVNFLIPIIFLYGLFFLADFLENGFFALIYASIIFVSGYFISQLSDIRILSIKNNLTHLLLAFFFLTYTFSIFLLITASLSI